MASLTVPTVMAEPTAHERTQLSLVLRQLEAVTRQVNASAALPTDDQSRFTFDYARLSEDLEQVRGGIEGYLTPSRAQPRTPPELTGHYTRSAGSSP
ncbi:RAQPRD family integrative conjugative element protein [Pseudomonas batumici]|uniref:integrative conjugative element protein, RAQPRD family n=1 Tax=Pseudomonas batumici TaxID=226910 RepID=UPI0030CAC773